MEVITRLRKWGNSLGIVILINIINKRGFKEDEAVVVHVEKKRDLKELFGSLKGWEINSQKVKDEIRKEWSKKE